MKMIIRTAIAITALYLAQPSFAEGFYLAGRVGVSSADDTASASSTSTSGPGLPAEFTLDGRPFDSSDTAVGLAAGWNAKPWLAIEFAYTDLGEAESSLGTLIGPAIIGAPAFSPRLPPNVVARSILSPAGFLTTVPAATNKATLSIREWSLTARFSANIVSRLSANWSIGITHNEFDADGVLLVPQPIDPQPVPPSPGFEFVGVPYATPSSEAGFAWGLGFEWAFNDRFAADVGYRQHKTGVLDVEAVALQLKLSL